MQDRRHGQFSLDETSPGHHSRNDQQGDEANTNNQFIDSEPSWVQRAAQFTVGAVREITGLNKLDPSALAGSASAAPQNSKKRAGGEFSGAEDREPTWLRRAAHVTVETIDESDLQSIPLARPENGPGPAHPSRVGRTPNQDADAMRRLYDEAMHQQLQQNAHRSRKGRMQNIYAGQAPRAYHGQINSYYDLGANAGRWLKRGIIMVIVIAGGYVFWQRSALVDHSEDTAYRLTAKRVDEATDEMRKKPDSNPAPPSKARTSQKRVR